VTVPQESDIQEGRDAMRRTHLANERTQLAWWRTGLTALAVALAIGRLIPELAHSGVRWPYTVVGIGFVLYSGALIAYGTNRSRAVESALAKGEFAPAPTGELRLLAAAAIILCAATGALILFG
jgi:putative membrane protein